MSFLQAERCYWTLSSCKMHPWRCTLGPGSWSIGGFRGTRILVLVPWGGTIGGVVGSRMMVFVPWGGDILGGESINAQS